jgi:thymidylate synthase
MYSSISQLRETFIEKLANAEYVTDKSGVKMLEVLGVSFIADSPAIFGTPNQEYIDREIEWYKSQSLCVDDIPGETPQIWKDVSDRNGYIHSNYGYLIWSKENGSQYEKCLAELTRNSYSRRAIMIYTRPSIQDEYDSDGMSDFICTNAVQYLIRDGRMNAVVQMRSNDVIFGYRNDYAWQKHVLDTLVQHYNCLCTSEEQRVSAGDIIWNAGSLHVYERHFNYVK